MTDSGVFLGWTVSVNQWARRIDPSTQKLSQIYDVIIQLEGFIPLNL